MPGEVIKQMVRVPVTEHGVVLLVMEEQEQVMVVMEVRDMATQEVVVLLMGL